MSTSLNNHQEGFSSMADFIFFVTEVVISSLVTNFRFSPSKKEMDIDWKSSSIATPFIGEKPSLPIVLSPV